VEEDLYCKIYIDSSRSKAELLDHISNMVQGEISLRSIESKTMEIDVMENDEYDKNKASQEDGFVYYPYYLEIDVVEGINSSTYIETINNMLRELRNSCANAIASCDFEDKLTVKAI
jgi:hypothetical protein